MFKKLRLDARVMKIYFNEYTFFGILVVVVAE